MQTSPSFNRPDSSMKADGAVRTTEREQTKKEKRQIQHMIEES